MNVLKELFQSAVLCMCLAFPAGAEVGKVYMSEDPNILIFTAPIEEHSLFAMTTLYKKYHYTQINITSPGGDYDVGMQVAKFIYENKIKVFVPKYCASACTFAFFSASTEDRDLAHDAQLGLHNISFSTSAVNPNKTYISVDETMKFAQEVSRRTGVMMALYSANGIPPDVLYEVAGKYGDTIVNVSRKDLVAWGTLQ